MGQVLSVRNLFKTYNEDFFAVKNLNLTFYNDHISVLLGHNGAGKTTTIGMLTGLIAKSQGEAKVYGLDLFS